MKSKLLWMITLGLSSIIVLALSLAIPAMLRADSNSQNSVSATEFTRLYKQALIDPLNKASSEVKDPELASFSQKLITAYDLQSSKVNDSNADKSALADLLPDLGKINKAALNMPLTEAGKQLKDQELSDFYSRFLNKCGVTK